MADDGVLEINLEELTPDEIDDIETYLDMALDSAFAPGQRRGKPLRAIAWIVKRRENPDFSIEDAGKVRIRLVDEKADPTDAAS